MSESTKKRIGKARRKLRAISRREFKWKIKNVYNATSHPIIWWRDRDAMNKTVCALRKIAHTEQSAPDLVPKIIHFVFGFKEAEEFAYYMYLSIKSTAIANPSYKIYFHYCHEPKGIYWDMAKELVTLNRVPDFRFFGLAALHHYAHKADIIRLLVLREIGGFYLDIDTLTVKSFERFRYAPFTMGIQADAHDAKGGLCNAVMVARRNSLFVRTWLKEYSSFHSKGRDKYWDYHSVKLPLALAADKPDEIEIANHATFFFPLWHDIDRFLLAETSGAYENDFGHSYVIHLWNGVTEKALLTISPNYVATSDSTFARLVRALGASS